MKCSKRFVFIFFAIFLLAILAIRYTYGLHVELGSFSIERVREENNQLYLDVTPAHNAIFYKVLGYDLEQNLIYEQESTNSNILLTDLYGNYKDTITFQVYAYSGKGTFLKAQNEYKYIFKDVSIGKTTEHYNKKGQDFVIGFDGDSSLASYTVDVYYENTFLKSIPIINNMAVIAHEILDELHGNVYLKINKENTRIVHVFSLYANSPIVGNISITNLKDGTTLTWDDFTIHYDGGINATTLQVNLYKDGVLENQLEQEYTKDGIFLPASFFKEDSDYLLELVAVYKDYFEIAKKDSVMIHVLNKQTVEPVYVDYNYKNLKKGTEVSLATNTQDADIYYTFDGSTPTTSSYLYKEPIPIHEDVTIKAIAIRKNMFDSEVNTYDFHVGTKQLVVYLSPSNQYLNYGIKGSGYTTEKNEMNKLTDYLEVYLKEKGVKVYRNRPSGDINAWILESNYVKSDLHLAIHSNASLTKEAHGIEMYVDNATSLSLSIANKIYNHLYQIYPYKDQFSNRGVKYSDKSLGEANDSFLPCGTLIEVAYHDNYNDAKWIVEHREEIAKNIGDSILEYYQIS